MNERIKELMVQVCKEQGLPFTVEHNRAYMLDNFSEKFAELIVKECLSYMKDGDIDFVKFMIKQHFGVEE
jgi:hypothetical protein